MFKRVALFLATNLAVLALVSIVMSVLGVNPDQFGGLLVMAALFGFGGSIISLLMSKWVAKRFTGAQVIETPRNEAEQWLVSTVRRQAELAGIGMPEVAIYDAPEINAFATGANRNNALVAVSTGLLRAMNRMNDFVPHASVQGKLLYRGRDVYASDPVDLRRRVIDAGAERDLVVRPRRRRDARVRRERGQL